MDQNTRDWLNRIEGKLDTALVAIAEHKTDITWLKGGIGICLTIVLGCASYIAVRFFDLLKP